MHETHLTQEMIDGGPAGATDKGEDSGLIAKALDHPVLAGGAVLVGAGLAFAAARIIGGSGEHSGVANEVHVETSIAIDRPAAELYAFWRDFRNLPLFMKNLESVSELEQGRTHWVAKGLNGVRVEWDAEIYNEIENELIAWRSLDNADVVNAGSVRFQEGPEGHGTYVRIAMNYNPPAGKIGAALAQLLGAEPAQLIREDLRCLKQMLEAGEVATIAGQSSGRSAIESATETKGSTMGDPEEVEQASALNLKQANEGAKI
jgi:uncharacterized membrane protein